MQTWQTRSSVLLHVRKAKIYSICIKSFFLFAPPLPILVIHMTVWLHSSLFPVSHQVLAHGGRLNHCIFSLCFNIVGFFMLQHKVNSDDCCREMMLYKWKLTERKINPFRCQCYSFFSYIKVVIFICSLLLMLMHDNLMESPLYCRS